MIISSATDYREAARRKLPRFLFDYLDGGAGSEETLRANVSDLALVKVRQRVLRNVSGVSTHVELFGDELTAPIILAPIGLGGMFARRGEVQVGSAARAAGIPYILSTVSVCSLEEVTAGSQANLWFQLYVLKDRGFMKAALEKALALGVTKLVFTVDMPVPGTRYRDRRSGMSGPGAEFKRILQALSKPSWTFDVGLRGRPHDLGNISAYRGKSTGLSDYIAWLGENFDPSIQWKDLEWIRDFWPATMIIKGILDPEDACDAQRFGADGVVVSNHGGRQLDGAVSSTRALPEIANAVGDSLTVLADSGVRTGLDVLKLLALGARGVLLGRAYAYALAARGEPGVAHLLRLVRQDLQTAMALAGIRSTDQITRAVLAR